MLVLPSFVQLWYLVGCTTMLLMSLAVDCSFKFIQSSCTWLLPSATISAPAWQQLWPQHQDGVAISPSLLCWCLLLVSVVSATDDFPCPWQHCLCLVLLSIMGHCHGSHCSMLQLPLVLALFSLSFLLLLLFLFAFLFCCHCCPFHLV